jgi:hypothetical protein
VNLALCLEQLRVDGSVGLFLRIARHYLDAGHRVRVFAGDGPMAEAFRSAGARVEIFAAMSPQSDVPRAEAVARLQEAFAADRPDAIVAVAVRPFPLADEASGGTIPTYYFVLSCDLFADDVAAVRRASATSRILACAILDARVHAECFGFDPALVLASPLPIEAAAPMAGTEGRRRLAVRQEERVVLTVVRLDDDHIAYVTPLLGAIDQLRRAGLPLRAVVVGDGSRASEIRASAPRDTIFTGTILDLNPLYAAADIYCGEGTSKHEATVRGIPTLVTAGQTHPDLADCALHLNGIQSSSTTNIDPCSVIAPLPLATAIALVAEDLPRFKVLGAHAARRILRDHDVQRFMHWLDRVLIGDRRSDVSPVLDEGELLTIDAARSELQVAARTVRIEPSRYALRSRAPIPWEWFYTLDPASWPAVADSARRRAR